MLKTYRLVTKDGETIKSIECYGKYDAVVIFGKIKNLKVRDLLEIFSIECD